MNILSALGFSAEENYLRAKQGISGVRHYGACTRGVPEAFAASLLDREAVEDLFAQHFPPSSRAGRFTALDKASILSVHAANQQAGIDLSSPSTRFFFSTTKGNVDLLKQSASSLDQDLYLWHTAQKIAAFFGNPGKPVVVSNACVSGAAAQIAALRELQAGRGEHAVVVGADLLSPFIISGFQAFKALSPQICRPFDRRRNGLNLGEAAATLILSRRHSAASGAAECRLLSGAIRNDATHISAPSRTGEGSLLALKALARDRSSGLDQLKEEISFINAHGTATPYNDAMEAVAITRAGWQEIPVNSLKALFGHTLGAAGILESIISIQALKENLILKSFRFEEQDFETPINLSATHQPSNKKRFVKMVSGFGGVNAALLFEKIEKT